MMRIDFSLKHLSLLNRPDSGRVQWGLKMSLSGNLGEPETTGEV